MTRKLIVAILFAVAVLVSVDAVYAAGKKKTKITTTKAVKKPQPKQVIFRGEPEILDRLWLAVIKQESQSGKKRVSHLSIKENSVGIAQIRPCMVKDCNRIVGKKKWSLADRDNDVKSREMFNTFILNYGKNKPLREVASMWNGGPKGWKKADARAYSAIIMKSMK